MAFDPLTWAFGATANALTKKAAALMFPEDLPAALREAARKWSNELPSDAYTPPESLFQVATTERDDEPAAPAITALQERLVEGRVPDAKLWQDALVEHWEKAKARLGTRANPFFALPKGTAVPLLAKLASAFERACVTDASMFRQTANTKLDLILKHTQEIQNQVQKLVPQAPLPSAFKLADADLLAPSLFVCTSPESTTIGVAVTNSGLIICVSGGSKVTSVRSLATGKVLSVSEYISSGPLIHVFRCEGETTGVVPAYANGFAFDAKTAPWRAYDLVGGAQTMTESMFAVSTRVMSFGAAFELKDLVAAKSSNVSAGFTPGPVFNACNELVGLVLGAWYTRSGKGTDWSAVEYVIQPWSEISKCIHIQAAPFPRKPDAPPLPPLPPPPPAST